MMVDVFNDVLTDDEWDMVFNTHIRSDNWAYGQWSADHDRTIDHAPMYWGMRLKHVEFFNTTMFNRIKELTGDDLELLNVYAGANTFGTSGDIHVDSLVGNRMTFLHHISPDVWQPMFGGKTTFYPNYPDTKGGIYHEFVPNQGLYFESDLRHVGEPVTKFFNGLRVCIAFKLKLAGFP